MSAEVLENMIRLNKEAGIKRGIKSAASSAFDMLTPQQKVYAKQALDKVQAAGENLNTSDMAGFLKSQDKQTLHAKRFLNFVDQRARKKEIDALKDTAADYASAKEGQKVFTEGIKKGFKSDTAQSSITEQAKHKLWGLLSRDSKKFGRDPKLLAKGQNALIKHQDAAVKKLIAEGIDPEKAKKMVQGWADDFTGTSFRKGVGKGTLAGVGTTIGAMEATGGDTIDATGQLASEALSGSVEKGTDIATGTTKDKRTKPFDTNTTATIPKTVDTIPQPEQKASLVGNIAELLDTQPAYTGAGALAGGGLAYGIQKAMEDDNITAEERESLRKRQILITALASLAGGAGGAGLHYMRNKKASQEHTHLVSSIQEDAKKMSDEELEHRVAEIKRKRLMNKQASENKAAIKEQLITARKLGIF
jgi:hypothetical protein